MESDTARAVEEVVWPAPEGLSDAGLVGELVRAGREVGRWQARQIALIGEADRRGVARREGFPSTTAWLMAVSGEPAPACRSQLAVAEALEAMPETKAAFETGAVSVSRVRVLAQAQALAPEAFARDEAQLVAEVGAASSQQVPEVLAAWKQTADPQAAEAEVARLHEMRGLHVTKAWTGMVHVSGDLDPAGGLVVLTALGSLTEPACLNPSDTRTPAQCRADALVQVCQRFLQGTPSGTSRPQVTVTIPWHTLQEGSGIVDTDTGPITGATARLLACDATIRRILLDPNGVPVEVGRACRVIPPTLRRALELRDRHCTHPGCDRPARWCDAHHIQHWAQGGKTDLSNLRLLCPTHHTLTHQHDWHPQRE